MVSIFAKRPRWVEKQLEMSKYIGKRKHCSQLQQEEIDIIWRKLNSVEDWNLSDHTFDRLIEKGINATHEDLVSVIKDSRIIEYKIDYIRKLNRCEERVILRANSIVNGKYNLNVVYGINQNTIVTVWINHINDNHSTLRFDELYDSNLKVFKD